MKIIFDHGKIGHLKLSDDQCADLVKSIMILTRFDILREQD
jgi:hypothetical protein